MCQEKCNGLAFIYHVSLWLYACFCMCALLWVVVCNCRCLCAFARLSMHVHICVYLCGLVCVHVRCACIWMLVSNVWIAFIIIYFNPLWVVSRRDFKVKDLPHFLNCNAFIFFPFISWCSISWLCCRQQQQKLKFMKTYHLQNVSNYVLGWGWWSAILLKVVFFFNSVRGQLRREENWAVNLHFST